MPAALALHGVRKSFDGFLALDDARFSADWGEVHALLGENGAGKSSLMNIAAGLYAPEAGTIEVDGRAVRLSGPNDAKAQRIGMVHQHFKLVRPFTVAENILLANPQAGDRSSHGARLKQIERDMAARAAALGFEVDARRRIESLSIAEQQRVEILKVLVGGARILILDEPTAVLTDGEAERLLVTVRALAQTGTCVVLVTHKMADVMTYADRVTVMRAGKTVTTADPRTTSTAELIKLTVGDNVQPPERAPSTPGAVQLRVRDLRATSANGHTVLNGVAFDVRASEIYGIAGVGGNGQSELAEAVAGLPIAAGATRAGEVALEGVGNLVEARTGKSGAHRAGRLAVIPADRYGVGLAGMLSVAENFAIGEAHTGRYGPPGRLARSTMESATANAAREFNVQGVRSVRQSAALLSGGNAQKLVIAREFSKRPQLVLAHSPSRGLDVRATAEVYGRLLAARAAGAAVLLISEDLDEVLALADRVGVMSRGRIVAQFEQPADRQAVGRAMVDHA
jgi:simple sugar transport system ATP-binding protein